MDKWTPEDEAQLQALKAKRERALNEVFAVIGLAGWNQESDAIVAHFLILHAAAVRKALEPFDASTDHE